MKNKTNCRGLHNDYKKMLEKLTEWDKVGGYIYDINYTSGELPYHGYEGEHLENEQKIANSVIDAYNKLVEKLKNAIGE